MITVTLHINELDDDDEFSVLSELLNTIDEFSTNYYYPIMRSVNYDNAFVDFEENEDDIELDDDYEEPQPTEASVIAVA